MGHDRYCPTTTGSDAACCCPAIAAVRADAAREAQAVDPRRTLADAVTHGRAAVTTAWAILRGRR